MAMEMICGLCRGNMLVEQFGVVVECPHCGGHVRVPEQEEKKPPRASSSSSRPKSGSESRSPSSSSESQKKQKHRVDHSDVRLQRQPEVPKPTSRRPKPSEPSQPASKPRDPVPTLPADENPFPFFTADEPPAAPPPKQFTEKPSSSSKPTQSSEVSVRETAKPTAPKTPTPPVTEQLPGFPFFSDHERPAETPPIPEPQADNESPKVEAQPDFANLFGQAEPEPPTEPEPEPVPSPDFSFAEPEPPGQPTSSAASPPAEQPFAFSDLEPALNHPTSDVPEVPPIEESPATELPDSSASVLDEAPAESPSASQVFGAMFGEQSSPAEAPFEPIAPVTVEPTTTDESFPLTNRIDRDDTPESVADEVSNPLAEMFAPSFSPAPSDDQESHDLFAEVEAPSSDSVEPDHPDSLAPAIVESQTSDAVPTEREVTVNAESDADFLQFLGADAAVDQPIPSNEPESPPLIPVESDEPEVGDAPQLFEEAISDDDDAPQLLDDADEDLVARDWNDAAKDFMEETVPQPVDSLMAPDADSVSPTELESEPTSGSEDSLPFAILSALTAESPPDITEPRHDLASAASEAEAIAVAPEMLPEQHDDQSAPESNVLLDRPEPPAVFESPTTALAEEAPVHDEPVWHFDDLTHDESPAPDSLAETFQEDEPQGFEDNEPADQSSTTTIAADVSATAPKREADGYLWISKGKLTMLMAYAAAITLGFALVLVRYIQAGGASGGSGGGNDLESLPDLAPPKTKNGKQVQFILIPPESEMPAGHDLKIGDSQRFGNIKVTVQKVTRGPLKFIHFKEPGKARLPSAPVLKLWLKFENVSKDQEIAPLDSSLLFSRSGKNRFDWRGNQTVCRAADKTKKSGKVLAYDHPFKDEWDLANLPLGKPLKPGESRELYIPTSENDLEKLTGDLVWRVHFRKGYSPKGYGVTTVFEVQFASAVIQDESA